MSEAQRVRTATDEAQREASDPSWSAWVSANAGAGKTEVLVRRVMRLMLDGAKPDEILCLTYTKAAAAVMTNRVFERLSAWIALNDDELRESIRHLAGERPSDARLRRARELFADALETPGGLKIQTIHAFCERLLHLFPFGADIPAHFEVLDEEGRAELLEEAIAAIVAGEGPRREELAEAFARVAEDTFDEEFRALLADMLTARAEATDGFDPAQARAAQIASLAAALGVSESDTPEALIGDYCAHAFWKGGCQALIAALRDHPNATNNGSADRLAAILAAAGDAGRFAAAQAWLLTKAGASRARATLMTDKARAAAGDMSDLLDAEMERFSSLLDRLSALETLARNRALFVVADAVLAHYRAAKARRGALDFDDLIAKTRALLANEGVGPWILYKLDARLSHILVDEAQDTSDAQWDIVRRLAEEFTAGAGARADRRTIFAVGDEKQSIYGFQGAAPKSFARMREHFSRAHRDAGLPFKRVPLRVSFRSTREVLAAVDRVFAGAARMRGLAFESSEAIAHESRRIDSDDIGFVELWPIVGKLDAPEIENALDPDEAAPAADIVSPQLRLAARIARNVRLLIDNGDPAGRPVKAGDIMILVRRRGALFEAIIAALKQIGVPVAGADRLKVARHIAVMDCLALGRAMISDDDDHALACALKSPLLGLDDEDLLRIAPGRKGMLLGALREAAEAEGGRLAEARDRIERWRRRTALGPFDFFARIIDAEEGRRRFAARLGAEASDALDEFLARALDFERREGSSLAAFLAGFEGAEIEIKRDLDQAANEARVMTVHAAKGLEAPIVILPDMTGAPGGGRAPAVIGVVAGNAPLDVWAPGGARSPAIEEARRRAEAETEDEHRRLLYVALTRARNGLIIAGATGQKNVPPASWYAQVAATLEEGDPESGARLETRPARDGEGEIRRFMLPGRDPATARLEGARAAAPASPPLPGWAERRPDEETARRPPLSPSRGAEAADRRDRPLDRSEAAAARARGRLAHRLLEILPGVPAERREQAAATLARRSAAPLAAGERDAIARGVLAILGDAAHAKLFGPASRAEVAVAGAAALPGGGAARVSGVIDRLAVGEDEVLIGDYKTSARPPPDAAATPHRIVAQLALYRALIAPLYPARRIRCLVLWTAAPIAHELSDAQLDAALARWAIAARGGDEEAALD